MSSVSHPFATDWLDDRLPFARLGCPGFGASVRARARSRKDLQWRRETASEHEASTLNYASNASSTRKEVNMVRLTAERLVLRVTVGESPKRQSDSLAGEEPLELRVGGRSLAVTMRTPGADFDLAAGFLVSEGVITGPQQLSSMRYCAGSNDGPNQYNLLDLTLASGVAPPDESSARAFFTTSSCGLCGKASIDAVRTRSAFEVR